MISIVDYGIGNIHSLTSAFEKEGYDIKLTSDYKTLKQSEFIILPGVGAFKYAMNELEKNNLIDVLNELKDQKKTIVGICLGMQLMYEKSFEHGECQGLGFLKGEVDLLPQEVKIPHMGWNSLTLDQQKSPLLRHIAPEDYVYFVHSYYANHIEKETLVASTGYGVTIPAIVQKDQVIGFQFHPEKSGKVGMQLIRNLREAI